jgi:hypothetical protein
MFQMKLKTASTLFLMALALFGYTTLTAKAKTESTMPAQTVGDFSFSPPASVSVKRGSGNRFDVPVQSLNGFSGRVDFTVSGLPNATIGGIGFATVSAGGTAIATGGFQTHKVTTPMGSFTLTITATSGNLSHTGTMTLICR